MAHDAPEPLHDRTDGPAPEPRERRVRPFVSYGPALAALGVGALTLVAAPVAIRQMQFAYVSAGVVLAQQRLDEDDLLERLNRAVADVADAVEPSVVHIDAWLSDGPRRPFSKGSGWVFDEQGRVVTNAHVVRGAERIAVQFADGHVEEAELLGLDPSTDIAVLKVDPGAGVVPMRRASGEAVRRGERVFAFGSPFDFKFSMSEGIVSALGRNALGVVGFNGYTNFIQTDAAVNPGNSGGPLVDVNGRVVGMTTAIVTSDSPMSRAEERQQSAGIGFAIPLDTIESVVGQIVSRGVVMKGFLGVSIDQTSLSAVDRGLRGQGLVVARVTPGYAAAQAGLRPGDVVTHIDGQRVPSSWVFRSRVSNRLPGDRITLTIVRGEETLDLPVIVGGARFNAAGDLEPIDPGRPMPEDPALARANRGAESLSRLGVADVAAVDDGVRLLLVRADSPAYAAGLRSGQIVLRVGERRATTPADIYDAALGRAPVTLLIRDEENNERTLTLPAAE